MSRFKPRWKPKIVTVIVIAVLLCSCQSQSPHRRSNELGYGGGAAGSAFVQTDGTHFVRRGRPYYFAGANLWYGAYLGGTADGLARLEAQLDQLQAMGVNNVRVLAASEPTALSMTVDPAVHLGSGEYLEQQLRGLDVLLAEVSERDMVAVLYLNNFWQWSAGMAQYVSWSTGEAPPNPGVSGDWNDFIQNSAAFYRSEQAQRGYQSLIEAVITRTNSVNGQAYVEDPTIMAWQLPGAPRSSRKKGGEEYSEAYNNWIKATVTFIKSLDANHLVSTGSDGPPGTQQDIDFYRKTHEASGVDYLTVHLWPKNGGWFDLKTQQVYRSAMTAAKAYILQHLQVAEALSLPAVMEVSGVERDSAAYDSRAGTVQREHFLTDLFQFIERQARLGTPIAGSHFGVWDGVDRGQPGGLNWRNGQPFSGDPTPAPQGLNSVLGVDQSTLDVLSGHARFMNAL